MFNKKLINSLQGKIECLEKRNKFLSALLEDCSIKQYLNKNIEQIEWHPIGKNLIKTGVYLVRILLRNYNSIIPIAYNDNTGWSTGSNYIITHWAEAKGPEL